MIFAYPEISVLAHEPSMAKRNLLSQALIERVELADEDFFIEKIRTADCAILL
jgi:tRNA 2-thiouridine synthesizing protein C